MPTVTWKQEEANSPTQRLGLTTVLRNPCPTYFQNTPGDGAFSFWPGINSTCWG